VIHAGIYYAPGSLKARLCKAGAAATKAFCAERGIPFAQPGKLIVASNSLELQRLADLQGRAALNGLSAERLDAGELRRREPHVTGLGALFLPDTGIVDYRLVAEAMARQIRSLGGDILLNARVETLTEDGAGVTVGLAGMEPVRAGQLVACAGIQADRIAAKAGVGDGFSMDGALPR